jgi:uncharacterized membrane-anchored protein
MQFLKRQLPIAVAFIVGLVLWAVFYMPSTAAQEVQQSFTAWAIILSGAALILGILSAIHHHWSKVNFQKPGYGYSLVTIFCFGFVVIAGWFTSEHRPWPLYASLALAVIGVLLAVTYFTRRERGDSATTRANGIGSLLFLVLGLVGVFGIVPLQKYYFTGLTIKEGSVFDWVFQNMFVPLDATMFSLLAFYIASAAFRAFRARSFEATALLIAGCIVMIGRVPLGEQLSVQLLGNEISFSTVASWILNNPNAAAQRGILLGVLLSMVAISLRIIFGIERTYMGGAD